LQGLPLPAVRRLSKRLSDEPDPPLGEHVGIIKIVSALARKVCDAGPGWVKAQPMAFYEDCLIDQLPGCPMGAVEIADLVW
jgi:hypothetical protein